MAAFEGADTAANGAGVSGSAASGAPSVSLNYPARQLGLGRGR